MSRWVELEKEAQQYMSAAVKAIKKDEDVKGAIRLSLKAAATLCECAYEVLSAVEKEKDKMWWFWLEASRAYVSLRLALFELCRLAKYERDPEFDAFVFRMFLRAQSLWRFLLANGVYQPPPVKPPRGA